IREERREHDRDFDRDVHQWAKTHPARTADLKAISREKFVLTKELAAGTITPQQAQTMNDQLKAIKALQTEMARANQNGGHLDAAQEKQIETDLQNVKSQLAANPPPKPAAPTAPTATPPAQ
ncbi:MAG TPA: hypothetical protein VMU17_08035, partial [Elusimicrobiota bacterium]|nr:hypothetical protein [Elusimicrobiota bacterium]